MQEIYKTLILGIACAGITAFIQALFWPNMILHWWFKYIVQLHDKGGFKRPLSKLLGLCPYCYGFWLTITVGLYYIGFSLDLFLIIGIWYLVLELSLQKLTIVYPKNNIK